MDLKNVYDLRLAGFCENEYGLDSNEISGEKSG